MSIDVVTIGYITAAIIIISRNMKLVFTNIYLYKKKKPLARATLGGSAIVYIHKKK